MDVFNITSFASAFSWVIAHGYPLMFVAMLIEGPIVTAAATFAVVFGYFNISMIFVLSILGDIVADVIYYIIGYFSRIQVTHSGPAHTWTHDSGSDQDATSKIRDHLCGYNNSQDDLFYDCRLLFRSGL